MIREALQRNVSHRAGALAVTERCCWSSAFLSHLSSQVQTHPLQLKWSPGVRVVLCSFTLFLSITDIFLATLFSGCDTLLVRARASLQDPSVQLWSRKPASLNQPLLGRSASGKFWVQTGDARRWDQVVSELGNFSKSCCCSSRGLSTAERNHLHTGRPGRLHLHNELTDLTG